MANFAAQKGWTPATAGNFSVRASDGIAITASGFDKGALRAENILLVHSMAKHRETVSHLQKHLCI
jgi:ribulose-5-phosphate 4-epimerase/fuculose-1-phosphate aldolase